MIIQKSAKNGCKDIQILYDVCDTCYRTLIL
jgi:hypothetical protein